MKDELLELERGGRIRVRVGGEGPGLILLHGFASGIDGWPPAELERLARRRRVVAVDLPGHGRSGPARPGDATPERLVGLLETVRLRCLDDSPPTLLGYSMGARLALTALAAGLPIRRLLLESANPGLESDAERVRRARWDEQWAMRFASDPPATTLDAWLAQPIFTSRAALSPEAARHQRRVRESADFSSLSTFMREFGTGRMPSTWDAIARAPVPMRLLVGALDARYVALSERIRERGADVLVEAVEGVGHAPHVESPRRWGRWVDAEAPSA